MYQTNASNVHPLNLGCQKLLPSGPKNLVDRLPQPRKLKLQTRHRYHQVLYNHSHGHLQTFKCLKHLHAQLQRFKQGYHYIHNPSGQKHWMTRVKLGIFWILEKKKYINQRITEALFGKELVKSVRPSSFIVFQVLTILSSNFHQSQFKSNEEFQKLTQT